MSIEEKHEDLAVLYVETRAKLQALTDEEQTLRADMLVQLDEIERRGRECEALRAANTNLLEQVKDLKHCNLVHGEEIERFREINKKNAQHAYAAMEKAEKAEELQAENTRLRKAILEQATLYASILKAILPA